MPERALIVVSGAVASGKSTVARELAGIAERGGRRSAVIDLDEVWLMLDRQRPRTGGAETWLLARHGAAALTDLFFSSGIDVVLCEGPFFTAEERDGYTRHLRTPVVARFVTLTVPFDESLRRALADPHPDRVVSKDPAWLRERYALSTALLEAVRGTDLIVETGGRTAHEIAGEIAAAMGL
jgi:chloramphenicol 3-O-phosphotransferase